MTRSSFSDTRLLFETRLWRDLYWPIFHSRAHLLVWIQLLVVEAVEAVKAVEVIAHSVAMPAILNVANNWVE